MTEHLTQAIDVQLFWWAFIGYSVAALGYIVFLAMEKKPIATVATVVMGAAFALQTAAMVARSIQEGHLPLTNMFEYVSLLAWFAAIFYFIYLRIYRQQILGAIVTLIIFMLMVSASLLPKEATMQLVPALQSYWLKIHVSVACLGEAAFAVAFAANLLYLIKNTGKTGLAGRLPDLGTLDRIGYKAVTVGYPLFTVGALFAGAIWAHQAWGSFWSWDPKEVGSLIAWLIYSAYLHARLQRGWIGVRAALLSMTGFLCTLLTFFANLVLGGLHAYG